MAGLYIPHQRSRRRDGTHHKQVIRATQGQTILTVRMRRAYNSAFPRAQLIERTVQRRAIEAMNWGLSAVNYDLMLQEMLNKTEGKVNQIIYWSRPLKPIGAAVKAQADAAKYESKVKSALSN